MKAVFDILMVVLDLYWWVVAIAVIMSWLFAFNVINTGNQFVQMIWRMIYQLTEPVFQRVRRFVPAVGGLDLSPLIVLLGIMFIQIVIHRYGYPNVF